MVSLEALAVPVFTLDASGSLLATNPSFEQLLRSVGVSGASRVADLPLAPTHAGLVTAAVDAVFAHFARCLECPEAVPPPPPPPAAAASDPHVAVAPSPVPVDATA